MAFCETSVYLLNILIQVMTNQSLFIIGEFGGRLILSDIVNRLIERVFFLSDHMWFMWQQWWTWWQGYLLRKSKIKSVISCQFCDMLINYEKTDILFSKEKKILAKN